METAQRLEGINEYYFSQKLREIDLLNKEEKNILNLGIGSPDMAPHPDVVASLQQAAGRNDTHAYQGYKGVATLRQAMANFYENWYGFLPDADTQVLPLMGSKEGIMHICMTYLNEGDVALIPDPGYPTYAAAVSLAGAEPLTYDLLAENNYSPDFDVLKEQLNQLKTSDKNCKLMFVNYPHMPTGEQGSAALFEKLLQFAKDQQLIIVNDNPYSFILNKKPISILSVPGAIEHVIELNSLSKTFNMAGWRVGMLIAKEDRINAILKFKSNMDSGMFMPVQLAAVTALSLPPEWLEQLNEKYVSRRKLVFSLLNLLNCTYDENQVGMFVWAKIPAAEKDGYTFSDKILLDANVFITPGGIFGKNGSAYIRVSLCSNEEKLMEAINRVKKIL